MRLPFISSLSKEGRFALGILVALAFLNYLDRNILFPMLNLIAKDLGLRDTQLGALTTGFHVVYAMTAPLLGYFADHIPRKKILIASLISWSLVTALSGTATTFLSLIIFRSLTGLGEGGYFPTAISLIGDLFADDQRGRVIAIHGVAATLGGSSGYAVGGVLGETWGWRTTFFLAVVPGLLLTWPLIKGFVEPARGTASKKDQPLAKKRVGFRQYLSIITSPPVLLIALAASAAGFTMNGVNTFMPKYLEDVRNFSVSSAGIASGFFYSATILGQLSGGIFSDKYATRVVALRPIFVSAAYWVVAPAVLGIFSAGNAAFALVAYGLTQISRGFAEPNLYGTIIESVPADERGTAQGFLLMLTFIGSSISPLVSGLMLERGGYRLVFFVLAGSAILAGVFSSALTWRARHRRPNQTLSSVV